MPEYPPERIRVAVLVADEPEAAMGRRELSKYSAEREITAYDGMLTGWTTREGLAALRQKGLMAKITSAPPAQVKEKRRFCQQMAAAASLKSMAPGMEALPTAAPAVSGTFIVKVRGPMRPHWRTALAEHGFKILEQVERCAWLVSGDLQGLEKLASEEWIADLSQPESASAYEGETPPLSLRKTRVRALEGRVAALDMPEQETETSPRRFDVFVYAPESLEKVRDILKTADLTVVEETRDALRFQGANSDAVLQTLKALPDVRYAGEFHPPRLHCAAGLETIGWHRINPNPASLQWTGEGEVIGVADSGVDRDHPDLVDAMEPTLDFAGALPNDSVGHGTHVCGIAVGRGKSVVTGVAPKARAIMRIVIGNDGAFVLPLDYNTVFQPLVDAGASVLNLSWGWALGGDYDQGSWQVDTYAKEHPDVLMVISAGNFGKAGPDGNHAVRTLGAPASAKNVITVGASTLKCPRPAKADGTIECTLCTQNWGTFRASKFSRAPASQEAICGPPVATAGISSRGPTEFQSIKPDLIAPGVLVESARSQFAPGPQPIFENGCPVKSAEHSACASGTSMAAPFVSGAAAVIRQWLRQNVGVAQPSAALLKACLISCAGRIPSADPASPLAPGYPDFGQGYGLLDLTRLLGVPETTTPNFICADVPNNSAKGLASRMDPTAVIKSQQLIRFQVAPGAVGPLRICLTWTDLPGKHLQNNLQLDLQIPGGGFKLGNEELRYGADPLDPSGGDAHNNVEVIDVPAPAAGIYRVRVVAESTLFPNPAGANPLTTTQGSQGFAITIVGPVTSLAPPLGGLAFQTLKPHQAGPVA